MRNMQRCRHGHLLVHELYQVLRLQGLPPLQLHQPLHHFGDQALCDHLRALGHVLLFLLCPQEGRVAVGVQGLGALADSLGAELANQVPEGMLGGWTEGAERGECRWREGLGGCAWGQRWSPTRNHFCPRRGLWLCTDTAEERFMAYPTFRAFFWEGVDKPA